VRVVAGETPGWRDVDVFVDGAKILATVADEEAGYAIVHVRDETGTAAVSPVHHAPLRARVEGRVEIRTVR